MQGTELVRGEDIEGRSAGRRAERQLFHEPGAIRGRRLPEACRVLGNGFVRDDVSAIADVLPQHGGVLAGIGTDVENAVDLEVLEEVPQVLPLENTRDVTHRQHVNVERLLDSTA